MRWLILSLCMTLTVPAAAQAPANASDEAAVRDLVQRYTRARELSDPKAIEALFTADADQYTSSGDWRRGLPRLVTGMLETSARNPGIVDGEYKTGTDARQLWTTLVVKREQKTWRIAAIRNMAPTGPTK
jgi:hypothetical protein